MVDNRYDKNLRVRQPLLSNQSIVERDGKPTTYFMRWLQNLVSTVSGIDLTSPPVDGQGIAWNTAASAWSPVDLFSVEGEPVNGDSIVWNEAEEQWEARTLVINDLDDVNAFPTEGQALVWNDTEGYWEARTIGGGSSDGFRVEAVGTTTPQDITVPIPLANTFEVFVFVNGLKWNADDYSLTSPTEVNLGTNADGDSVELIKPQDVKVSFRVTETGTGASQTITLPDFPVNLFVFINGLKWDEDDYDLTGDTVTLSSNANLDSIEIIGYD